MTNILTYSQDYISSSSHFENTKALGINYISGQNFSGFGLSMFYYPYDNIHISLNTGLNSYSYKSYSEENITISADLGVTLYEIDSRSAIEFINYLNFTPVFGFGIDLIKNTSSTILNQDKKNYTYLYGGIVLEYSFFETIGFNIYFNQQYGLGSSIETFGQFRSNYGLSIRYYIFR